MSEFQEKPIPQDIPLDFLEFWEEANVRKRDVLLNIEDLAKNIKAIGLQVPLLVKEESSKKFLVFSGQRRLLACRMVEGLDKVPCLVFKKISLLDAQILSLSENLYRQPMNEDDIAQAANNLNRKLKSLKGVARKLGISESKVRSYLKYIVVPDEIKKFVRDRKLTAFQAINIHSKFGDTKKAKEVADEYAKIKTKPKKSKFFQSIKVASPNDTIETLHRRARKLGEMVSYQIFLPPQDSATIKRIALRQGIQESEVIVRILEQWIAEYNQGRTKFDVIYPSNESG